MIKIQDITKRWTPGGAPVLNGVSLEVAPGERLYLLGPNGAGKSTLLKILSGHFPADAGSIRIADRDVSRTSHETRAQWVKLVTQDPNQSLLLEETVLGNLVLAESRANGGVPWLFPARRIRKRILDRLAPLRTSLADRLDNPASTLSGGERQALAMLMALLRPPQLLLLDEPTKELDGRMKTEINALAERLLKESKPATIVVTHDYDDALRMGNRILVLQNGRVESSLTPRSPDWTPEGLSRLLWPKGQA